MGGPGDGAAQGSQPEAAQRGRVATRKAREEEARRERAKEAERQRIESGARKNDDKALEDARARYLARKAAAEKAAKK